MYKNKQETKATPYKIMGLQKHTKGDKCRKCTNEIKGLSVHCTKCKKNLHLKCSDLTKYSIRVLADTNRHYMCTKCFEETRGEEKIKIIDKQIDETMKEEMELLEMQIENEKEKEKKKQKGVTLEDHKEKEIVIEAYKKTKGNKKPHESNIGSINTDKIKETQ